MGPIERSAVGAAIGVACVWSCFVLGWWISASLSILKVLPIQDRGIAATAFAGLGAGILLDLLYLKRWVGGFYKIDWRLGTVLYMFLLLLATASFMGLPVGTFTLGLVAGIYLGRRHSHRGTAAEIFARKAKTGSLLVALATASSALGVGVLALRDKHILSTIGDSIGTGTKPATLMAGAAMLACLCLSLLAAQYWCTYKAAKLSFSWKMHSRNTGASAGTRT